MDSEEYTVLIVDDEEMVTASISTLLRLETDYNILIFNSPSEALDTLRVEKVDLAISDYLMPGEMNGVEFLLELKKLQPEAIRILLTAYADKENAIRAINEVGLYQYVEKPWDNDVLLLLIRNGLFLQREIAERKRSEEALRLERAQLLSIFDSINEIIHVTEPETYKIIYANKALKDSFKKNLIGGICYKELQGLESPCDFCTNEIVLKKKHKPHQWEYHNPILKRDFIITDKIIKWPDGSDVRFEIAVDITERKRAEELARLQQQQLMQADKMATLGILSSGVAHEINNPNNFILLNAKIFSRVWSDVTPILEEYCENHGDFALAGMPYTRAHERIGQLVSGMFEGAQRIQKIVQGLKDFARPDAGDSNQLVDINSVMEAAILITGNLIKKSTDRFSCDYGSNLPKIRGNTQQLEQVVINLVTNACHALLSGRRVRGRTDGRSHTAIRRVAPSPCRLLISTSYDRDSDSVIVKVCDEGAGISPEQLKHIMDPFFTTKRASGGTGLGLSISYNIVKAHGGDLNFSSELGKGTTVLLTLPAGKLPS